MFFFKKSNSPSRSFWVFRNKMAKYQALLMDLLRADSPKVLYCFFENTAAELDTLCKAKGVDVEVMLVDGAVPSSSQVWLAELHPYKAVFDQALEQLPAGTLVKVYVDFEEPLMKTLLSDRTVQLMEQLGMRDNEAINHSLVNKAIERALEGMQKKLGRHEDDRSSPESWMKANAK